MKILLLVSIFLIASCSHDRRPASQKGHPIAYDSMALGNVKATAVKRSENQKVCFDVNLTMKNVSQENAQESNWTLAWIDKNNQYHLVSPRLRNPASVPDSRQVVTSFGHFQEWSNAFTACTNFAEIEDVKTLVLVPKSLPYNEKDGLQLKWVK